MSGTEGATPKPSKKPLSELVEIEDARWLVTQDELDPRLARVYSTKGRVGKVAGLQRDSESLRWVGESKLRGLPKWLAVAWEQVQSLAAKQHKYPVLMLHVKGTRQDEHTLHVISRKEHEELMAALKELEHLQVENEELKEQLAGQTTEQANPELLRALREYASRLDSVSRGLRDTIREEERH